MRDASVQYEDAVSIIIIHRVNRQGKNHVSPKRLGRNHWQVSSAVAPCP